MAESYVKEIGEYGELLKKFRKDAKLFALENELLEIEQTRYKMLYHEVHQIQARKKTAESEDKIRELLRDVIMLDIPVVEAKVKRFGETLEFLQSTKQKVADKEGQINNCYRFLQSWLELHEGFWALASFRSLEHFAQFMEMDITDENKKVWKHSLDPYNDGGYTGVNKPFFHYFNQMVMKKDIKFISKQYPTGVGKSYGNQVAIAWLMGVDKENDVLIVLGNPALVSINANGIIGIMTNPRFAKVFPAYAQYFDDGNVSDKMFSICRVKQGEICIEGTTRPMNVKIICKETPIDGIRVKFLFLDDVCRSKDANNLKAHEEDIKNFWDSWYKRNYGTDNFYIVAGGTAYSVEDILSHLILYYSGGKLIRTNTNKYTYKNANGDCVFIKIPKIDDDLNRSTYPQKFPYEEAVKARDRNYRMFMAMEQQQPLNSETCPFAWENLMTYEELPDGLSDYSVALLDPARSGQNYVSMAIFRVKEERDKFNAVNKVYYLVDCVYRLKKMEDMYQEIVDKVEKHHIVKLHIENNTDTSLKNLLDKMFHEKHILFCETIEFYSTENKETKLKELTYKNWGYITKQMKFPCYNMYPPAHPMGKFMQHITCYDFKHKNDYDDSIDTVCMFIERFMANTVMFHKAKIVRV